MKFEYKCKNCQKEFEVNQTIVEKPLEDCPNCDSEKTLYRLIGTNTNFVLKGKGWYKKGGY